MACKREDRFRHNTIAFWLSDEEKKNTTTQAPPLKKKHNTSLSTTVTERVESKEKEKC